MRGQAWKGKAISAGIHAHGVKTVHGLRDA